MGVSGNWIRVRIHAQAQMEFYHWEGVAGIGKTYTDLPFDNYYAKTLT